MSNSRATVFTPHPLWWIDELQNCQSTRPSSSYCSPGLLTKPLEVHRQVDEQVAPGHVIQRRERVALSVGRVAARVDDIDARRILIEHVVAAHAQRDAIPRVRGTQIKVAYRWNATIR